MPIKTMITELRWFLRGKTNIRELLFEGVIYGMVMHTNNINEHVYMN